MFFLPHFKPHMQQVPSIWRTSGLGAHSSANALAKLLWAYFSPSVLFCCSSFFCKHITLNWKNSFWGVKALKSMKKWYKKSKKCLKIAKIHAQKKKTVVINAWFRVSDAQNKVSYCVRLKLWCLISIKRASVLRKIFFLAWK